MSDPVIGHIGYSPDFVPRSGGAFAVSVLLEVRARLGTPGGVSVTDWAARIAVPLATASDAVRAFRAMAGLPCGERPAFPALDRRALHMELIDEEVAEIQLAEDADDLVGVADGIADAIYVLVGMAVEYGIPIERVFAEVHRANMAKRRPDGSVVKRADGKILKPEGWAPPDVARVLREASERGSP